MSLHIIIPKTYALDPMPTPRASDTRPTFDELLIREEEERRNRVINMKGKNEREKV